MKQLYQNHLVEISLDETYGIIEMAWLPEATHMSDNDFKQVFTHYAELTEQYHPSFNLTYSKGGNYIILPHLQEWLAENIMPRTYQAGVAFRAIVVVEDILAQVAAEQTLDEANARMTTTRFFSNREQARKWLIKLYESRKLAYNA
jgi:hypothetical protein